LKSKSEKRKSKKIEKIKKEYQQEVIDKIKEKLGDLEDKKLKNGKVIFSYIFLFG